jgi:hypothetical protein
MFPQYSQSKIEFLIGMKLERILIVLNFVIIERYLGNTLYSGAIG